MFSRTGAFVAGLTAIVLTFSTANAAAAATFGVQASAVTGGFTGTGAQYPAYGDGQTYVAALSNPAGLTFNNGYGLVSAEAYANALTTPGFLYGKSRTVATRISATAFGYGPSASTDTRFNDYLTVKSDTLPVGTPVTLVFRSRLNVTSNLTGLFTASINASLYIAGASAYLQTTTDYQSQAGLSVTSPQVTVNTKVGARLSTSGKLSVLTKAYYFAPGPVYSGSAELEVSSDTVLEQAPEGVRIEADSGADYNPPL
jgi:hypothetical protein